MVSPSVVREHDFTGVVDGRRIGVGKVSGVMKFAAPKMYDYAGVIVSGEQAVLSTAVMS